MKLFDTKIKKIPTFSKKRVLVIYPEIDTCTFQAKNKKIKKNPPRESLLYSGKIELSSSNIKEFFLFSQKKVFLIFQEMETVKESLMFSQKKAVLIFRKMETLKSYLYFRKRTFLIFHDT